MSSGATDQSLSLFVMRRRAASLPASAPVTAASDEDLLLRLEAQDFSAVGPLFDHYSALIFGVALRILRDRGEAEDLVQDVFLHLYEKARGFDAVRGSARTWIVQIAYRRAFDRRAYLSRRSFYNGTDVDLLTNTLCVTADRALEKLIAVDELRVGFDGLSDKQRLTLEMYFFEGLDLREISKRLSETIENTRHFYYRGLEGLRRSVAAMSKPKKI